jgi:hypothetical protein
MRIPFEKIPYRVRLIGGGVAAVVGVTGMVFGLFATEHVSDAHEARIVSQQKAYDKLTTKVTNEIWKCSGSTNWNVIPASITYGGYISTQDGIVANADGSTSAGTAHFSKKDKTLTIFGAGKTLCTIPIPAAIIAVN